MIIPGNTAATIFDHLPQFEITPNMFGNSTSNKSNIYERGWIKFDRENFVQDYLSIYWEYLLKIDKPNVDNSNQMYLEKINILLENYALLKRIDKQKLRFKSKPWINLGLQKSIWIKNKLLPKFINAKDLIMKEETHIEYKNYRHLICTPKKKIKQAYYNKYFETHGKELNS